MCRSGDNPPEQVEKEELSGPKCVLQRADERPEHDHVAEHMEEVAVQEHVREQANRFAPGQIGGDHAPLTHELAGGGLGEVEGPRVKRVGIDVLDGLLPEPGLVTVDHHVDNDEHDADKREVAFLNVVANGDEHGRILARAVVGLRSSALSDVSMRPRVPRTRDTLL